MVPAAAKYQLKWALPFAVLGVMCDEDVLWQVEYLPRKTPPLPPQNILAAECLRQLNSYLKQPRRHRFQLPLLPAATAHQRRVRDIVQSVAGGATLTYGDVARRLGNSSARAVGGACRANAVPLIVPCHRIVAANGLGGFMGEGQDKTPIKKHLLRLEGAL